MLYSSCAVLQEDQTAAHLREVLRRDPAPSVEAACRAGGAPAAILVKGKPPARRGGAAGRTAALHRSRAGAVEPGLQRSPS